MKLLRQNWVGIALLILFCSLSFGYLLLSSRPSPAPKPDTRLSEKQPSRPHSGKFIPGGVRIPGDDALPPLRSEAVLSGLSQASELTQASDEITLRARALSLSENLMLQPPAPGHENEALREFVFELFDDVRLIGRVERLERHHDDRAVYYGSLTNVGGGDFILAYNQGQVAANFTTPGMGSYKLRPNGRGEVVALEVEPSRLPPCTAGPNDGGSSAFDAAASVQRRAKAALHQMHAAAPAVEGGTYGGSGQQGGAAEGLVFTTIDVLVVHTQNATAAAGGQAALDTIIDATMARANSSLINSEVGLRVRLVRAEEVNYTEVDSNTSLSAITNGSGPFSNVASWRSASGADLVALIFNGGGGLGWIYNGNINSGFSVSGLAGLEGTFIHELGHNFGCLHDRANSSETPDYPYSYGWKFTPEGSEVLLHTIMAYAPGSRIPYFSNPDVTYMGTATGVPIGDALQSHNAEVIRQTKASIAAFFSENGNAAPSVTLNSPLYDDSLQAMDTVGLSASATDSDGSVQEVRFYRLMSDSDFNFSDTFSTSLGTDSSAPYNGSESSVPAGFWTYAAVARDNGGGVGVDTVSVAVAPHYRETKLPLPSGKSVARIEAINEAGRVGGFGHNGNVNATDTQAAYWENGNITLLNPLSGDTGAKALAVAQSGIIYGESISSGGTRRAIRWNNSTTPTNISGLIGGFNAISALGVDYLDRVYLVDASNDYRRYDNPGSTTAGLNVFWSGAGNTGPFATGEDYHFGSNTFRAQRWNGTGTFLPPVATFASSWGRAVNRFGAVFGISSPDPFGYGGGDARLTFWPAGSTSPLDLGTLGSEGGLADGLNDWNHAVGYARNPQGGSVAIIWKGQGSLLKLSDLTLPTLGLKREANAINNRGQIAGTGFQGPAAYAYFLDPMPGLDHRYWLADHFNPAELEDDNLTDDSAILADDGLSNLIKRGFGIDPRVPASVQERAKLPRVSLEEDGRFHFHFRRLRTPSDIQYSPEGSLTLDLNSWDENMLEHVETTFLDDDYEEIHMRTSFPISAEEKAFLRLRLDR